MSEGWGEEVHAHMRRILKLAEGLGGDEEDVASALLWSSVKWAALQHYRVNLKIMSRCTAPCVLPIQKRANPSLPTGN